MQIVNHRGSDGNTVKMHDAPFQAIITLRMGKKRVRQHLHHCAKSLSCVTGVVFIWYGIGLLLEYVQEYLFAGYEMWLAIGCVVAGVLILYLPDKDLDELG